MFFDGFTLDHADLAEARIRFRCGGSGSPVVLLHGHPRTHVTWHRVAALLDDRFTVVCPDLRGYCGSSGPPTAPDHAPYSKLAMARDVVELMARLGHDRFAVVGHDRGSYVAFRTAMDHPDAVERLVVLDSVPIGEALRRADARFARMWWHWFFLGQTEKPAERVIDADPDAWYGATAEHMGAEAFADLRTALHDPATVHAMCEDYRAVLTVDRAHDEEDRTSGRRLRCPTLVLWSSHDDMEELYGDPLEGWQDWTTELSGGRVESGHHMAEEAPEELAARLVAFLAPSDCPNRSVGDRHMSTRTSS